MVKRFCFLFSFLLVATLSVSQEKSVAQEKKDTNYVKVLHSYIDRYLESVPLITDSLISASDHLIAFSEDPVVKSHIAGYLFDRFSRYPVMGMESVAVYIAKEYFLNGRVKPSDEDQRFFISLYVKLNENSLIGMDAPDLRLPGPEGDSVSLRKIKSSYQLIWFYDDKCNVCKTELPLIKELLSQFEFLDISLYAVYTQASKEDFVNSVKEIISGVQMTDKKWYFVWDPTFESGFHLLYNVISTPQLFLLDKDKKIIGRNLNSRSLHVLLNDETARLNNLSPVTANFLWSYLPLFNLKDTAELRSAFQPLFENSTGGKNEEPYRTVFLEMFEYLAASGVDSLEDAAVWLAENYIINRRELWWDNSVPEIHVPKVVSRIQRNRAGSIANDFSLTDSKGRVSEISSHRGKKYTVLYFYTEDCPVCSLATGQLKQVWKTLKKRGVNIVGIDATGEGSSFLNYIRKNRIKWKSFYSPADQRQELYYLFVTNKVPCFYLLDRDWRIITRGQDINKLEEFTR